MMHISPLLQFLMDLLKLMENLYVVAFFTLVMIGIRFLRAYQVRHIKLGKDKKDLGLEVIDTLIIALILVFGIIRPVFLQTFFIPSGSMEPTLQLQDKLIANKFIYLVHPPQRGDVVVFQPPVEAIIGNGNLPLLTREWLMANPGKLTPDELTILREALAQNLHNTGQNPGLLATNVHISTDQQLLNLLPTAQTDDFIKRVIGMPGDHIRIVAGQGVYVNGTLLAETYLPHHVSASAKTFPVAPPALTPLPRLNMFLKANTPGDDQQLALNLYASAMLAWLDNWSQTVYLYQNRIAPHVVNGEFVVPAHTIFVMGDNRTLTGSFDSRYWGLVPDKNVKGRAVSTFWPLNRLEVL
jgi:signal peptidase I